MLGAQFYTMCLGVYLADLLTSTQSQSADVSGKISPWTVPLRNTGCTIYTKALWFANSVVTSQR